MSGADMIHHTPAISPQGPRPLKTAQPNGSSEFARVLSDAASRGIKLSAHAQDRIMRREIGLDPERVARLESAMGRAERKGVKQSLIVMDELALLVSIKNRTVLTAMEAQKTKEGVFTNIDGVVIA